MRTTNGHSSSDTSDDISITRLDGDDAELYPVASQDAPELDDDMSALDAYLARLGNLEPLSDEKQAELARRYREEDDDAAGQLLVMTNLRLVMKLAKDYTRDWDDLLDLVQEGNVGISKALDRYDPSKNVKFTTYAQYWIRARILDYLINRGRPVRLGASRAGRKLFYNLNDVRESLRDKGLEPTPERIAEVLDVPVEDVIRVGTQIDEAPVSLDEKVGDDSSFTIGDMMEADVPDPEESFAERESRETVREALERFAEQLDDDRRYAIWEERIVADDEKTLRELGEDWDVSKERIRQIESELRTDFQLYFADFVGGTSNVEEYLAA